jgi:hypothetical protein
VKTNPIAAAGAALILTSCASVLNIPQTRDEFVRHPQVQNQTYTVPRPLDAVVASLDRAKRCTDDESAQTRTGGGGMVSTSRDLYYMTIGKTAPNRAEMAYRWASNTMAGQPKGGYLLLLADLEAQGAKATKVTLYHSAGRDSQVSALKEWSRGQDQACHGFERK